MTLIPTIGLLLCALVLQCAGSGASYRSGQLHHYGIRSDLGLAMGAAALCAAYAAGRVL